MRIGNLPRSGSPKGAHPGHLLRILLLAAVGAALLAVWQVMPLFLKQDPAGRTSSAVSQPEMPAKRQQAGPAPATTRHSAAPVSTSAVAPISTSAAPPPSAPAAAPAASPAVTPPAASAPAPRVVYAGPPVTSGAGPAPGRAGTGAMAIADPAPGPAAAPPTPQAPPAAARVEAVPAPVPSPEVASAPPVSDANEPATGTGAAGRVDLNTATVEELNALPGAGLIGRAIVRGRPYASPEELLTKRVLNRATYDRIKDQVTAQ